MKKIFVYILTLFSLIVCMPLSTHRIKANTITEDFYNCSVTDQLEKLQVPTDDYNDKVITMTQFYDDEKVLHSYVYVNNSLSSLGSTYYLNISTSTADSKGSITEDVKSYQLSYIQHDVYDESTSSCYIRYEINDLPNLQYSTRRYYINSLGYRSLVTDVVDKVFIFNGINNEHLKVFNQDVETIEITEKEVHFYCYGKSSSWLSFLLNEDYLRYGIDYVDAWYVFFNTDKEIDKLTSIEISYQEYEYAYATVSTPRMDYDDFKYDDLKDSTMTQKMFLKEPISTTIDIGKTTITSSSNAWYSKYSESVDLDNIMDLRKHSLEIGDSFCFKEQAEKFTWGVNFLNTKRTATSLPSAFVAQQSLIEGCGVKEVAILRLKFVTNGVEHDCYAIDIPTDDFHGNSAPIKDNNKDKKPDLKFILTIIALVLLYLILRPILKPLFKLVLAPFKLLFDKLLSIIKKPFKKRKRRK